MNKLQSLKEEARAEFHIILDADSSDDDWLDSLIDRTYHATKEELIQAIKADTQETKVFSCADEAEGYEIRNREVNKALAALEDTTTYPNH